MKKKVILVILFILLTFASGQKAFSYWIWTPKTGKWVNPKYAPKPTPKEQLEYALSFYSENKFKEAERELKTLLRYYPKSAEAAEAQYYLGIVYEAQEKYYQAYQAYQKVIDKYPFSSRIQEINEREFKIAEKFMSGEKRKFAGVPLPVENPSIEIFQKVVDNSQYGPLAPIAKYKLGLVFMGLGRYFEAEEAFEKVIKDYPASEWAAAAQYQLASCQAKESKGPEYDNVAMQEAKGKFEEFVKEHPDANLSKEAEKNISVLKEKEAEANYNIAVFYEKQKAWVAAKSYYEIVMNNYSESQWAKPAKEKVQELEERIKGKQKINKNALKEIRRQEESQAKEEKIARKQAALLEKKEARQQKREQKLLAVEEKKKARLEKIRQAKEKKEQARQDKAELRAEKKAQKQQSLEEAKAAKQAKREAAKAAKAAKQALKEQARITKQARTEEIMAAKRLQKEEKLAEKQARIEAARAAKDARIRAAKEAKAVKLEQKRIAREEKIRKAQEAKAKKLMKKAEEKLARQEQVQADSLPKEEKFSKYTVLPAQIESPAASQ